MSSIRLWRSQVKGPVCSPTCSTSSPCPPVPAGVTSQGQCILEDSGSTTPNRCVIVCKSNDAEAGMTLLDAGVCPDKASCKPIQTTCAPLPRRVRCLCFGDILLVLWPHHFRLPWWATLRTARLSLHSNRAWGAGSAVCTYDM